MKKIICLFLVFTVTFLTVTSAFAECSHETTYEKYRYSAWYHLNADESDEYETTHYRSVYIRTYCKDCGQILDEYFAWTEWADHTLPCSLCHAE